MSRLIILFSFFISASTSSAQQWISSGATWHYGYESFNLLGYYKVIYEADTLIDGKACQQLGTYVHEFMYDSALNIVPVEIDTLSKYFTYSSGDTVYFQNEDFHPGFHILFNVDAAPGDSSLLGYDHGASACPPDVQHVDSIGTVSINSQTRRWVYLRPDFYNNVGLSYKAVEGIGCVEDFLLPLIRSCGDTVQQVDNVPFTFRCFENGSFMYNPSGEPCDYPFGVGIAENGYGVNFSVFPNPADDQFTLQFRQPVQWQTSIELTDIHGRGIFQSSITDQTSTLHLAVAPGIYFLTVKEKGEKTFVEKLVVE